MLQRPQTMAQLAASAIRVGIFSGEFKPGAQLIPAELEKQLNLGRAPIREALQELSASGLVCLSMNRSATVAPPPSANELEELFELRRELEGKAVYRAALNITPAQIKYLRKLNKKLNKINDQLDATETNRQLHLEIYAASGWNFLYKLISQIYDQILFVRTYYPTDLSLQSEFNEEHAAVIDALEARDSKKAQVLMQSHIDKLYALLTKHKSEPETLP